MRNFLLFALLVYCFIFGILGREVGGLPYGTLIEGIIVILIVATVITAPKDHWSSVNSDLFFLYFFWFVISVLEVVNPGASTRGWLQEIRSAALYPFLMVPLGLVIFRTNKQLDKFLVVVVFLSSIAALNGIKQLYYRPWPGEQFFLNNGGAITHILWGRLRVFSFYQDAGQFGASQASIGVIALVLSFGPFKKWKKLLLLGCALLNLYGMLISGTRGALFALVIGAFMAILLSKKFKVLLIGGIFTLGFLCFLKYTHIGDGNYQIYRLRTAVDPKDASLNVRFNTQKHLRDYMENLPFGGGLGVIGANGNLYNRDKYLSTVQPDSYFVKIWAMYGIVGLTIWLSMMTYFLGKCCGISWNIKDEALRIKMIALTAGIAGVLFCSYGNEVINTMPSSIVVYLSLVFVFISPHLDDAEKSDVFY